MRGKSEYPTTHADQHAPDGSDPLTGFIRYDFENVGDWLYVETTDHGGPNDYGINFVASDPIVFTSASFIDWSSEGGTIDTGSGGFGINAGGVTVTSNGPISLDSTTGDDISLITSGTGKVNIEPHGDCNIDPAGNCEVHLAPGKTFTVFDHLGNPKVRWTEATSDLHIPTGGTIVADL